MKQNLNIHSLFILLTISVIYCTSLKSYAQGVLFSKYRVVLDNKNIQTLQVCNPTDDFHSYLVAIRDKGMNEKGTFYEVEDSIVVPNSLKKNIRVFPKLIQLAPGECQELQTQVRGIDKLEVGEYRSYLQLIPQNEEENDDEISENEDKGVAMNIIFRVSPAIPLIFRKDTHLSEVNIDSVYLAKKKEDGYTLNFSISRTGNQSTYGHIYLETKNNEEFDLVADIKGQAIYSELPRRSFSVTIPDYFINTIKNDGYANLRIRYVDAEKTANSLLCEKEVRLTLP